MRIEDIKVAADFAGRLIDAHKAIEKMDALKNEDTWVAFSIGDAQMGVLVPATVAGTAARGLAQWIAGQLTNLGVSPPPMPQRPPTPS